MGCTHLLGAAGAVSDVEMLPQHVLITVEPHRQLLSAAHSGHRAALQPRGAWDLELPGSPCIMGMCACAYLAWEFNLDRKMRERVTVPVQLPSPHAHLGRGWWAGSPAGPGAWLQTAGELCPAASHGHTLWFASGAER